MRLRLTALMISLVLLCGCTAGKADGERVKSLREQINAAASVTFRADLETDDGSVREKYAFYFTRSDTQTVIRLLYPELISGVTAKLSGPTAELSYDGLSIETTGLDENGLSPLRSPAIILSALEEGVISQLRRESLEGAETIAFRVLSLSGYETDVWIDAQTLIPQRAEILSGDRVAVCCAISEWSTEEG